MHDYRSIITDLFTIKEQNAEDIFHRIMEQENITIDTTFLRTYLKSITKRYRSHEKTGRKTYRLNGYYDLGYFDLNFLDSLPDRQFGQKLILKQMIARAKAERYN